MNKTIYEKIINQYFSTENYKEIHKLYEEDKKEAVVFMIDMLSRFLDSTIVYKNLTDKERETLEIYDNTIVMDLKQIHKTELLKAYHKAIKSSPNTVPILSDLYNRIEKEVFEEKNLDD